MSRGQIIRVATTAVAIGFILIGVFTHHWWSAKIKASPAALAGSGFENVGLDMSMDVGLRSIEACVNNLCEEAEWSRITPTGRGVLFRICSTVTYFGGIVACILLAVGVYLRETQGVDQVAGWGSTGCAVIAPFVLLTLFTFPDGGANSLVEVQTSVGYSFFLTLIGAIAGAVAGRLTDTGGWDGGTYQPVSIDNQPAPLPSVQPGPYAPQPGPSSYEYDARIREATATAPAPRNVRDLRKLGGASTTSDAAVDSVRASLRFVARSIEIMPGAGMTVVLESGQVRDLLWSQVGRVVARRLPPDPPYEKTLVVDIVPTGAAAEPVRLLPSTQANYAALGGPASMSSTENLRKLGQDIAAARPGVIEPHSQGFFTAGQVAPQFQAIKQFADYDAQYG